MNLLKRYAIFFSGIILISFGIVLCAKSDLGLAPVSSVPYVFSSIFPVSFGAFTFIFNILMLSVQVVILKGKLPAVQYLQVIIVLIFGMCIDAFARLLAPIEIESYMSRITVLFIGCIMQAFGVSLEVMADVLVLPGDGVVKTISNVYNKEFGMVKVSFDILMLAVSAVFSVLCLKKIIGVGEGSIIASITIGRMAKFFIKKIKIYI